MPDVKTPTSTTSAQVVARNGFIVETTSIAGIHLLATVQFADKSLGLVWSVGETMQVLLLDETDAVAVGTGLVPLHREVTVPTGNYLLGQTINAMGRSLDKKPLPKPEKLMPVFAEAPAFYDRAIVNSQLETGVTLVDTLFPVVMGQRIAILGDSKAGKTTFLTQAAIHQAKQGKIVVYVAITKHRHDVEKLQYRFYQSGVQKNVILMVADSFDPLPLAYLAPYAGCAIAESFWQAGKDVVVIYDDLSAHAKLYREMSLLLRTNPGREGFPGNMFYTHSSLLERAGKLKHSNASQTVLAAGTTPNGDITGYFSTNLISMTDGQIVFDLATMRKGVKPAVNIGLSVSRVGGRSQDPGFRELSSRVMEELAAYRQASSFSRFGTQLSQSATTQLQLGAKLYELFAQTPDQAFSLPEQRVMLEAVFLTQDIDSLNIGWLKSVIREVVKQNFKDNNYQALAKDLIKSNPVVK